MTDYFLIEMATFIMIGLVGFFMGIEEKDEFPNNVIWSMIATIFNYMSSLLVLATGEAFSISVTFGFVLFGSISFIMVCLFSWDAYKAWLTEKDRRRWSLDVWS